MRTTLILVCLLAALSVDAKRLPKSKRLQKGFRNELTVVVPMFLKLEECYGTAIGVGYNRYITKNGRFSVNAAFYLGSYKDLKRFYKIDCEDCPYNEGSLLLFTPGIQYHPFGNTRIANYSVGLACGLGTISDHHHLGQPNNQGIETIDAQRWFLGPSLTNDLVLNNYRHPHGVFGAHFSIGYNLNHNPEPFLQFGLKFGGKF